MRCRLTIDHSLSDAQVRLCSSNSLLWLPSPYRKANGAQRQEVQEPLVRDVHHLATASTLHLIATSFKSSSAK